jgi:hypothetical protein
MTLGIMTLILSPILLSFVPQTVANIVHHTSGVWNVFVPGENFLVFAFGFLLIFLSTMVLFLMDIRKSSITISVVLLFLSIGVFYIAAQSHETIGENHISFSPIFSLNKYTYSWEDVEKIIRTDPEKRGYYDYEFLFKDGNSMTLNYNAYVREILSKLGEKTKEMGIIMETYENE